MKSPFPGMDPYLEQHWLDVHHRLCTYSADALQPQLGEKFVARMNERIVIESPPDELQAFYPDVRISAGSKAGEFSPVASARRSAVAMPVLMEIESEPFRQAFVEIRERADLSKLVTVIEFISPSNKLSGDGRRQYRRKQHELLQSRVSLVEIDLTRRGKRRLIVPDREIPSKARDVYFASIFRGYRPSKLELYPIKLREKLPILPIPLRKGDSDVMLRLQEIIERAYTNGAYHADLDYAQPLTPSLSKSDKAWADKLLKSARKR